MTTRFFTNEGVNTLLNKFSGVFAANKDIEHFDALVGFLRSSGYFSVQPYLKNVQKVRILVGINVDEIIESYHRRGLLFLADPAATVEKLRKAIADDIQQAGYSPEVEVGIGQFVEDVLSGKLEIRAHPTRRLHAKIYIFLPEGFNEHKPGAVITGSSNMTDAGLGTRDAVSNYEFNVLLHDYDDVIFASDEFKRLWEEGVPILPKEIREIKEKSYLRTDITPFQLYMKLLIEHFGASIDYDPNSETDLPEEFMRLNYQMDAVSQGFQLLKKHRGFFMADVVGLGKTIVATLIAKKFFFHNGFPDHISSTLIVVTPAMEESWRTYVTKFELKETDIVTCGSLHKVRDSTKYDLVIVDEAQKFRTDTAQGYEALQKICKAPTKRHLPDGSVAEKRVILVSATPLNNKPEDIRNLLLLFQDGKDSTLQVANLQRFFHRLQKQYEHALRDKDRRRAHNTVKAIYEEIRSRVLQEVIIRRTRTDLRETPDYRNDLDQQGINFPDVEPPHKILYKLDASTEKLYDETVQILATRLTYNRYRAVSHLQPSLRIRYTFAELVANQLARIMKTMLLKRLDSSFHAFSNSLRRFRDATEAMVRMFETGRVYIAPEERVTDYILEGREEELLDRLTNLAVTDPTILICKATDFDPAYIEGLRADLLMLRDLTSRWSEVKEDPKLDEFKRRLKTEMFKADVNYGGKLIVFSEAKDTTDYLRDKLLEAGFKKLIAIDASSRKAYREQVRDNFDANIPIAEQKDDIDILISTEVLAEGVNLHRSNVVVNYDTPWNSTRLMQRIGRVNRIGTLAPKIHVYNFFPTANVDRDIDLQQRALLKLQAFHTALGEDSQIYSIDEEPVNFGLFEKAPVEERDETLEFLTELRRFRNEQPAQFKMIRNLPLRARVGRQDTGRAETSVVYVRNVRRDAFYCLGGSREGEAKTGPCVELGFVEAARIYRAGAQEKPFPIPDSHYGHVSAAVEAFREQLAVEATRDTLAIQQIGPGERRVMELLNALLNLPSKDAELVSAEDVELIRAGMEAVRVARFDPMRRRLAKIVGAHKRKPMPLSELVDRTIAILREFSLQTESEIGRERRFAGMAYEQLLPRIILSESFIK